MKNVDVHIFDLEFTGIQANKLQCEYNFICGKKNRFGTNEIIVVNRLNKTELRKKENEREKAKIQMSKWWARQSKGEKSAWNKQMNYYYETNWKVKFN